MKCSVTLCRGLLALLVITQCATAQERWFRFPKTVEAGIAFSAATAGSGKATLYIVGPGDVVRRNLQLGETISFGPSDLHNAGHYLAQLVAGSSTQTAEFDVVAAHQPASLSFLAKPSRLAVNQTDGISGVVYVFDVFHNLVLEPLPVSFVLSGAPGAAQSRTVTTRNGVAWIRMNSAAKAGAAQFQASAGNARERRVVQQVAGDPCSVRISARESGGRISLETEPVRDCSGNAVPDGTVVTFTEAYGSGQATVDVPLKRGVARTELPAHSGAVISAAIGVVMANEIHWNGGH
jgi:hypothetical protein